jgi:hypothetical protein
MFAFGISDCYENSILAFGDFVMEPNLQPLYVAFLYSALFFR